MARDRHNGRRQQTDSAGSSGDVSASGDISARDIVTGMHITHITYAYQAGGGTYSTVDYDVAVQQYLRWLVNTGNRLALRGRGSTEAKAVELPLDRTFIPLLCEWTPDSPSPSIAPDAGDIGASRPFTKYQRTWLPNLQPLGPRVVITGEPGSGKTTLLQYIALVLSRGLSGQSPHDAVSILGQMSELPLPIVVPLGLYAEHRERFAQAADPRLRQLATFVSHYLIERQAGLELPGDFFSILLKEGHQIMLMLDGLDEVRTREQRAVIAQCVRDLVAVRPDLRCLLTSRPSVVNHDVVLSPDFKSVHLLPLAREQVEDLVDRMYLALPTSERETTGQAGTAAELKSHLSGYGAQRASRSSGSAVPLFSSPLMVRLAFIAQRSGSTLPLNRAELYAQAVDALLTGDYNQDELAGAYAVGSSLTWRRCRELLQYLAFTLQLRRTSSSRDFAEEELSELLRRYLVADLRLGPDSTERLLDEFIASAREHSPLLEFKHDRFRFRDVGTQEFLAGRYIAEHVRDVAAIAEFMESPDRIFSDWWHEPFLLVLGYLWATTPDVALDLTLRLSGVAPRIREVSLLRLATAELAAAAALEFGVPDPSHRDALVSRLAELLGEEGIARIATSAQVRLRVAAGDLMGHLGDPRPGVGTAKHEGIASLGVFCEVPAGGYLRGSDLREDESAFRQEHPIRNAVIPYPFFISRYPVTEAQFGRFIEANDGYRDDSNWTVQGLEWRRNAGDEPGRRATGAPNHPATEVSWYEGDAYCTWLGRRIPQGGAIMVWRNGNLVPHDLASTAVRLPTSAEWEKAARGEEGRRFAWGDSVDPLFGVQRRVLVQRSTAVGLYPDEHSPYGAVDLCGNVWEWCRDAWLPSVGHSPWPTDRKEVRGGGFGPNKRMLRAACRFGNSANLRLDDLGFRPVVLCNASEE